MIVIALPRRRWFQYSLRSFLVFMTAFAVWLGILAERARQQREAVKAIEALGGKVTYDFQIIGVPYNGNPDPPHTVNRIFRPDADPPGPIWLRRLIGDEFFQEVHAVSFVEPSLGTLIPPVTEPTESDILETIPCLQRLTGLKRVEVSKHRHHNAALQLKAALPDCEIMSFVIDR
jgi:hypothetical protein